LSGHQRQNEIIVSISFALAQKKIIKDERTKKDKRVSEKIKNEQYLDMLNAFRKNGIE
jgi:hypothetical protein